MEMFLKLWLGIIFSVTFRCGSFVVGLPTGAPDSACADLAPGHSDQGVLIEPQTGTQSPFVIFTTQSTYDTTSSVTGKPLGKLSPKKM